MPGSDRGMSLLTQRKQRFIVLKLHLEDVTSESADCAMGGANKSGTLINLRLSTGNCAEPGNETEDLRSV